MTAATAPTLSEKIARYFTSPAGEVELAKLDAAAVAEDAAKRLAAAKTLAESETTLSRLVVEQKALVAKAQEPVTTAEARLRTAKAGLAAAEATKRSALYPVERQRDLARSFLERNIAPIVAAFVEECEARVGELGANIESRMGRTLDGREVAVATNYHAVIDGQALCRVLRDEARELNFAAIDDAALAQRVGELRKRLPPAKTPMTATEFGK